MKLMLQATLEFLHLENALFCAEQSVSAGADLLEVGSTLLKNTGLSSLKVLRERFPETSIIADMKIVGNVGKELKAAKEAGSNYVTVSGAASLDIWNESLKVAKELGLEIIIDFRNLEIGHNRFERIPKEVGMVFLSISPTSTFCNLQEAKLNMEVPVGVVGIFEDDDISQAISLGASTIALSFSDSEGQNFQNSIKKVQKVLTNSKKAFPADAVVVNEQNLVKMLEQLTPNHICEVSRTPVFLERIYPIHKYTKIIGKAATLRVWPGGQIPVIEFLMELPAGTIAVIDSGGQGAAVWGEIATEISLKRQLAGVIVHGSVTDVNKIRERGFPCYASNISVSGLHTNDMLIKNTTLDIHGVRVSPGDWILGDDTGIVSISTNKAFSIVTKALTLFQEKSKIAREIENSDDKALQELVKRLSDLSSFSTL